MYSVQCTVYSAQYRLELSGVQYGSNQPIFPLVVGIQHWLLITGQRNTAGSYQPSEGQRNLVRGEIKLVRDFSVQTGMI